MSLQLNDYSERPLPAVMEVKIAVMGTTGSGKTTFINLASDSDLRVGTGLESCTDKIQYSKPFFLDGQMVVLVDTPGFDDTTKSDAEILEIVCQYLTSEYLKGNKLHGIIYLHRITDNRMAGSTMRNFQFFQALCGPDAIKNCLIVTNMWGQVKPEVGASRELELKSKPNFFKPAIDNGARLLRHENTLQSAHNIVRQLISNTPYPFAIQRELVDEKKRIYETAAGDALLGEYAAQERRHQEELQELEKELDEALKAHDEDARQEIEEARQRLIEEQERVERERERLQHSHALVTAVQRQETSRGWKQTYHKLFLKFRNTFTALNCCGPRHRDTE